MWIILRDYIDKGKNVGVASPDFKGDASGLIHRFRLYDDDGNMYYDGVCDTDDSFDPLDDWGTPDAGCTSIKYYNEINKTWEEL